MRIEARLKKVEAQLLEKSTRVVVLWDPQNITEEQRAAIQQGADVITVIWSGTPAEEAEQRRLYQEAEL